MLNPRFVRVLQGLLAALVLCSHLLVPKPVAAASAQDQPAANALPDATALTRAAEALNAALAALDVGIYLPELSPAELDALWQSAERAAVPVQAALAVSQEGPAGQQHRETSRRVDVEMQELGRAVQTLGGALRSGSGVEAARSGLVAQLRRAMGEPQTPPQLANQLVTAPAASLPPLTLSSVSPHTVAGGPVQSSDTGESEDIIFTAELRALAAQLRGDPARIFAYVHNTIAFDPYAGSRKGAQLTLWERRGNDVDTASLLIALLRISGYPARYVQGTVVVDARTAQNWVGGAADLATAQAILSSAGVPAAITADARLAVEHTWVEVLADRSFQVWLPLLRNPGARGAAITSAADPSPAADPSWVALAPAFKQHSFADPVATPPFGSSTVAESMAALRAQLPLNTTTRSLRGLPRQASAERPADPTADQDLLTAQVAAATAAADAFLTANPTLTPAAFTGGATIIPVDGDALPEALPFAVASEPLPTSFGEVPAARRASLTVEVLETNARVSVAYSASLPALAGKRVTISYGAATANDQALIDQAGGSLLTAPVTVNLVPLIKVDGREVARGAPVRLGTFQTRRLSFSGPGSAARSAENRLSAGDTVAVAIAYGPGSTGAIEASRQRMGTALAALPAAGNGTFDPNTPGSIAEPVMGELMHLIMQMYFSQSDLAGELLARQSDVRWVRDLGGGVGVQSLSVVRLFGTPVAVSGGSLSMDVQLNYVHARSLVGEAARTRDWFAAWGDYTSAYEHAIFEWGGYRALSSIRLLNTAIERGEEVVVITPENRDQIVPFLQVGNQVRDLIVGYLDQGYSITTHRRPLTLGSWNGVGFIVRDPTTGASGYLIAGDLLAGASVLAGGALITALKQLADFAAAAYTFYGDLAAIVAALALILAGGPVGAALGLWLLINSVVSFTDDMCEYAKAARESRADSSKAGDYVAEHLKTSLTDKILDKLGGSVLDQISKSLPPDVAGRMYDQINKFTQGAAEQLVQKGLSKADVVEQYLRDKSPRALEELKNMLDELPLNTVKDLMEQTAAQADKALAELLKAANAAPDAPGRADAIAATAREPGYEGAYGLRRAGAAQLTQGGGLAQSGRVTAYRPSAAVTYRPVLGFQANGQPRFGDPVTEVLNADFVIDGTIWVDAWYSPVMGTDLRYWNQIMRGRAAVEAGLIQRFRIETAGPMEAYMLGWTGGFARNQVEIRVYLDDWFTP
jgi:hypothetical protein